MVPAVVVLLLVNNNCLGVVGVGVVGVGVSIDWYYIVVVVVVVWIDWYVIVIVVVFLIRVLNSTNND